MPHAAAFRGQISEPGIKDTNWSATAPILGPDAEEHRWVYLHYFKKVVACVCSS